jgi:hypothetical protein
MIFTHGLPWAVLAAIVAAASGWTGIAVAFVAAYLILRLGLAYTAGVWGLQDRSVASKLWLAPIRDAISAVVWFAGFFTDRITWRGLEYRVRNRLIEPVRNARTDTLQQNARGVK